MLIKFPSFNEEQERIRKDLLQQVPPNPSPEVKAVFQQRYQEALAGAKSLFEIQLNEVARKNTHTFLQNPVAVIEQLEKEKNSCFTIGEMLSFYGIGVTTCKRFGKGTRVGIGSDYPFTRSNFKVTATIGSFTLTRELASDNSDRSKRDNQSHVLEQLANQIRDEFLSVKEDKASSPSSPSLPEKTP